VVSVDNFFIAVASMATWEELDIFESGKLGFEQRKLSQERNDAEIWIKYDESSRLGGRIVSTALLPVAIRLSCAASNTRRQLNSTSVVNGAV
jgi:hypothetical protein